MSSEYLENSAPTARPAADRLLMALKTRGPQTTADLGAALGITGEAARQQLTKLAADGLVEARAEARGRLIAGREAETRAHYAAALAGAATLQERIARLAAIRSREGYMAEWR